jgi:two-component system heavy metal sensor histidine kinase CusS
MMWNAGAAFGLVIAATGFLYWGLTRGFEYGDDDILIERTQVLRGLLQHPENRYAELKWEVESEWEGVTAPQIYLRILDQWQNPILETRGMTELLPIGGFPVPAGPESALRSTRLASPAGRPFRAIAAVVTDTGRGKRWNIQAALDVGEEEQVLNRWRYLLVGIVGASALVSLAFGYHITRTGLRPLMEMVQATQRIRSSTLTERVGVQGLPSELAFLAENFNSMLERLEESFSRLSRFSANIAHELRTPLNVLRGEAEEALGQARSTERYREVLASSLDECSHMSRIIDALLFIARAEISANPISRERVDVRSELESIVEFYEAIASEKGVSLALRSGEALRVQADRVLFRRAVGNLVSNAIAFTPAGGDIRLMAREENAEMRIEVSDTGIGINSQHLEHIFDRLYRVDGDHPRGAGRTGLGLSIVRTIMEMHSGWVEITSEPGSGTQATLVFPCGLDAAA